MKRWTTATIIFASLCPAAFADCNYRAVIPTQTWTDFASTMIYLRGQVAPSGAVVDAFDPDGVHCGSKTITVPGQLEAMPVYADDRFTPNLDEGCEQYDKVTFRINGVRARVTEGVARFLGAGPIRIISLEAAAAGVGDTNEDSEINLADAVLLVGHIFSTGVPRVPLELADTNCDMRLNLADAVFLVRYLFLGGPEPCPEC